MKGLLGERNGFAKLVESEVREISASKEPNKKIALRYNISPSLVSMIKLGKCWTHLGLKSQRKERHLVCVIPNCGKPVVSKDLCAAHYERQKKYGDPLSGEAFKGEVFKFLHDVVLNYSDQDNCLFWPYAIGGRGYGVITINGKTRAVHRLVCKLKHGPPPFPKAQACHFKCGHAWCVNPHHIRWDTAKGNAHDMELHGTKVFGERNGSVKITDNEVRQIHAEEGTCKEIAERWRISEGHVRSIKQAKTRKHLNLAAVSALPGLKRGEQVKSAKLSETQVRYVRNSKKSNRALAKELLVDKTTIGNIRHRKTWKHID